MRKTVRVDMANTAELDKRWAVASEQADTRRHTEFPPSAPALVNGFRAPIKARPRPW
jgi:hypothetical protein